MKQEIGKTLCDRCGREYDDHTGWHVHLINDDDCAFLGLKAMFSRCGIGSKYDLCKKCILEIVKNFVDKIENVK